jgi:hypothetical protein
MERSELATSKRFLQARSKHQNLPMNVFTKVLCSSFLFLSPGWLVTSSFAQCDETELNSSDGATDDNFGAAIALDRDHLVVGASGDDTTAGSVYLFKKAGGGWVEKLKLVASDREQYDYFGSAVAIQKKRIVVAAPQDNDLGYHSGSVYVYTADGAHGFSETKLHAADGVENQLFGWNAVAILGNRIAIGARFDNTAGYAAGAAYIFGLSDGAWVQEAKLISDDIHAFDIFGSAVAIGGRSVAVGALGAQTDGVRVGAVYVFELDGGNWVQQAKLVTHDPDELDFFGSSVAMTRDGSRIISGATEDEGAGSAYIFRRDGDTWVEEAKLSGDGYGSFGTSVAINFPYCAIGAPFYGTAGATYLFLFDGANWNLVNRFEPSDGTFDDSYGQTVAIDAATLAAGAPLHKFESGPGAVYVYDPNCMASVK